MTTASTTSRDSFSELMAVYGPVAILVFAVVTLVLVLVAIRFRAGAGSTPSAVAEHARLEAAFVIALIVVAGLLLWRSFSALSDENAIAPIAADDGRPALVIDVVASRWNWRFAYPGGVVSTGNGVDRPATLVVPADRPVRFRMTSADVAHAFWIPELRTKYDALPGRTNAFGLRFPAGLDPTGSRCSEYCGVYHDRMTFRVDVRSPAAFARWLRDQGRGAR